MQKALAAACLVVVALATVTTTAIAHTHREKSCRYRTLDGNEAWSQHEVRLTIACGARRYGVPFDTVLAIAQRESGLRATAVNSSSGACGVYQHIPTWWPGRNAHHNRVSIPRWDVAPSCFNARANVLVSLRMMAQGGWSHWSL